MADPVLVADIGGTNVRFAIAERHHGVIAIRDAQTLHARDFKTIRDAAAAFLTGVDVKPVRGCFAAAGPVIVNEVEFTNSNWTLRAAEVAGPLGLAEFRIVNDFYALAVGAAHLGDGAFISVKEGKRMETAPQLILGPGTGLGQALIVPTGATRRVVATEGGHVSFAAQTEDELDVKKIIARDYRRVSVERLLSGGGLVNIYRALCEMRNVNNTPLQPDQITAAAAAGNDAIAVRTVNMFCEILGRVAGDAVLSTGARGGVILGGGILPKIQEAFLKSAFATCFVDKERMSDYIGAVPVKMIVDEGAALIGAAAVLDDES